MGTDVLYGSQKYWTYGSVFDGMLKTPSGITDFKYGQNNDFLFPNDKQVASRLNAGATPTATVSIKFLPKVTAIGHATATDVRRLGGVSPIYDGSRYWSFGLPAAGLIKKDFGQTFWFFGSTNGDLSPSTQGAIAIGKAVPTATVSIKFLPKVVAIGQATAVDVRRLGGAIDTQGNQKYWGTGQVDGLTFFALGNTLNLSNKNKFANQTLWYFGLPTPDMVGTTPVIVVSPAKVTSGSMESKRQANLWPPSIKIIEPRMPTKRTGTLS